MAHVNCFAAAAAGAALLVATAAASADLPSRTKSAAVEYVRVCDWVTEAGYYVVPGTETCVKIGGYVRGQYSVQSTANAFGPSGRLRSAFGANLQNASGSAVAIVAPPATSAVRYWGRAQENQGQLARGELVFDARTRTEYGRLRVLMQLQFDSGWGTLTPLATPLIVDKVYIQWAGLTAGRAESFFKFYDNLTETTYIGLRALVSSSVLFGYSVELGNGLQVGAAVEDPEARRGGVLQARGSAARGAIQTADVATSVAAASALPFRMPDVVASLKVEQSWGKAQIAGAWHQPAAAYGNNLVKTVNGYALLVGVNFNLPFLAQGDFLLVQGTYANGAVSYLGAGNAVNNPGATFLRADADFFLNTATGQAQSEKGYNLIANFRHYWAPNFWQAIYASYTRLTPGSNARAIDWTVGGIGNYRELRVSSQFVWAPTKAFTVGFEAMYEKTLNSLAGAGTNAPPVGYKKDYDSWIGRVRLNRIF